MQRALGLQQAGCNIFQSGRRHRPNLWHTFHFRHTICQAASTLSNGESEAASGSAQTSHSKAVTSVAAPEAASITGTSREHQPQQQQQQQARAGSTSSTADPTAATSAASSVDGTGAAQQPLCSPSLLRRFAASNSLLEVAEALAAEAPAGLQEEDARTMLSFFLQRGKVQLALALYREMCLAGRGGRGAASRSLDVAFAWPASTLATTRDLVLGLCQQLCTVEALQPQEGAKTVADSYSRYEYEVFSGTTVSCSSTALVPSGNLLLTLSRAVGLIKKPPVAAIHEFVLQAPDSTSRTFRVGTETAAVPAQVGERVTVVSAPMRNIRKAGLFNASPPGTKVGEALTATNHKTGAVLPLLRPPVSAEQAGVPGWVLPLAVVLTGGDAASSLLDPALPLLLAAVRVEYVRQQLLGQYSALAAKAEAALSESAEDVRFLARLWQLQNKMEAVSAAPAAAGLTGTGGGAAAAYEARIGRVARARANIEERLTRRIELLEGYSRVMNMIEIEVEMDIEVPAAELAGIEEQVARLVELESVQEDWRAQAEARDEVERLLRAA
ncbi:hypothetical protein VOLCADRAFT_85808 [Volvox carteri f. nagariensis]|uniref:Uncharacterized protein n=1 Tax=Volvox carteri f. nagariensis TaxID=3068 RepID=D8TH18_VOLCA|nr:uncharacterized protein VOLCADRAFT_85808 [Volvox carteri f. nagariensis]EFJ52995.1 hypothetical protein VOLCADRAFT_85808 [Volvox carteri f. nagariensis]|eukprot:XP_002946000.1 hypothetical protein VOLCADRAFT_85808 [Volvox carteri f. nagariensis]